MKPNGFDGEWNPICPLCGGYMHAHHTPDCPVVVRRQQENRKLTKAIIEALRPPPAGAA